MMLLAGAARAADDFVSAPEPGLDRPVVPSVLEDVSIAVYGGRSIEGNVLQPDSLPFIADFGGQTQAGFALTKTPLHLPFGFVFGAETGASIRYDDDRFGRSGVSGEVWFGPTLRHEGIPLGPILFRPGFTVGYTAVTGSFGLERRRGLDEGGDTTLLYFMAPEFGFALKKYPNVDLIYRVQHRSGGTNIDYLPTLSDIGDTNNANVFGVRFHF